MQYNDATRGFVKGAAFDFIKGHRKRKTVRYKIDANGCWVWLLGTNKNGYASEQVTGITQRVHIVNYENEYGKTPEGCELDHLCRNRQCVNPDHLEPVTHAENCRRGSTAKLTEIQVRRIKFMLKNNLFGKATIARQFGVHRTTISKIAMGKNWVNVGE